MSKMGWSTFNPHYSSLLLYQDKYGSTDRPLGTQESPYATSSGEKTYGVKDPEYWRRYRERRALGFPESAVTTPYYVGKYGKPGFRYYNHLDYYYPSYGRSLIPRSHYYPSYYPYVGDDYYYPSSLRPYSRYGYFSNWRVGDYLDGAVAAPVSSYSTAGRWNMDFPGYTRRVGATEIVKRVPQGFRLPVDFNARASSLPPASNHLQAMGPSVPVSQIHTLDLEVLPANIDANLAPNSGRRLLESLNIGADDLDWLPPAKSTKTTTKKRLAITSGGRSQEWVRRSRPRFADLIGWWGDYVKDVTLPAVPTNRYHEPSPTPPLHHHLLLPRVLPPSVTTPPTPPSPPPARRKPGAVAAAALPGFFTPLRPPYVLEKERRQQQQQQQQEGTRDPEREKVIKTSKELYFNIMGKVSVGGDDDNVFDRKDEGVDRNGLFDLIKTKGARIESVEILDFLRQPRGGRTPSAAKIEEI